MTDRETQNQNDRRMAGIIGFGKVVEVDLDGLHARVSDDGAVSGWFRMGMMRALGDQMTWPYEVGEEVVYVSLSGDFKTGAILCALPNGQTGATASVGVLRAVAGGGFELTGDVTVNGEIHATGDVVAGTVSLQTHTHPGCTTGSTGAPS